MLREFSAVKQIQKANNLAERAKSVFVETVRELVEANEMLCVVIDKEQEKIQESQLNIKVAGEQIKENDIAINKLKDFLR